MTGLSYGDKFQSGRRYLLVDYEEADELRNRDILLM